MILPLFSRPDPDAPLVTAARGGDVRAFDALVYRYQSRVGQFVRARLDAALDADEVAREIFVAAWRELPRFRARSRFRTWLFAIALRHCADATRKTTRLRTLLGAAEGSSLGIEELAGEAAEAAWPDALAERAELRERLASLAEPERQVLELYYYAELDLPEIAELLGLSFPTLRQRFYQAHRQLRRMRREPVASPAPAAMRRPQA